MSDPSATVSKEAFDLAIAQAAQYQAYIVTMAGVVSALGMFIGYKLFGLVQTVVQAISSNTTAIQSLQETIKERTNGKD